MTELEALLDQLQGIPSSHRITRDELIRLITKAIQQVQNQDDDFHFLEAKEENID